MTWEITSRNWRACATSWLTVVQSLAFFFFNVRRGIVLVLRNSGKYIFTRLSYKESDRNRREPRRRQRRHQFAEEKATDCTTVFFKVPRPAGSFTLFSPDVFSHWFDPVEWWWVMIYDLSYHIRLNMGNMQNPNPTTSLRCIVTSPLLKATASGNRQ